MDGEKLKRWRLVRRMSIQELAEKSGVNHSAISEMERNKRIARPKTIGKLADALDVSVEELLKDDLSDK